MNFYTLLTVEYTRVAHQCTVPPVWLEITDKFLFGNLTYSPSSKPSRTAGLGTAFFSVQNVPFFSVQKRERYVLFRFFLENLATYATQKNVLYFSVLF